MSLIPTEFECRYCDLSLEDQAEMVAVGIPERIEEECEDLAEVDRSYYESLFPEPE